MISDILVLEMKQRRKPSTRPRRTGAPFLHRVESLPDKFDPTRYPFNIRAFSRGINLEFRSTVTLFVGENGSGKSTLLEALAECCGFNPEGGNRDHHRATFAGVWRQVAPRTVTRRVVPVVVHESIRAGNLHPGRARSGIVAATSVVISQNHPRPRNTAACTVSRRNAFSDSPGISRRGHLRSRPRQHSADQLSGDEALSHHPRFSELAGTVFQASLSARRRAGERDLTGDWMDRRASKTHGLPRPARPRPT